MPRSLSAPIEHAVVHGASVHLEQVLVLSIADDAPHPDVWLEVMVIDELTVRDLDLEQMVQVDHADFSDVPGVELREGHRNRRESVSVSPAALLISIVRSCSRFSLYRSSALGVSSATYSAGGSHRQARQPNTYHSESCCLRSSHRCSPKLWNLLLAFRTSCRRASRGAGCAQGVGRRKAPLRTVERHSSASACAVGVS